jgi:outer membrane protein assembly factor BamB
MGTGVWVTNLGSQLVSPPVVSSNWIIYEATTGGILYALDASSGLLKWSYDLGSALITSPVLDKGNLYVVDSSGIVHAFGTPTLTSSTTSSVSGQITSLSTSGVTAASTSQTTSAKTAGLTQSTTSPTSPVSSTIPYLGSSTLAPTSISSWWLNLSDATFWLVWLAVAGLWIAIVGLVKKR